MDTLSPQLLNTAPIGGPMSSALENLCKSETGCPSSNETNHGADDCIKGTVLTSIENASIETEYADFQKP